MRLLTCAVIALVLAAFGTIQFASDAFSVRAAAPVSFVHLVPLRTARVIYHILDRIAPASYVETTLAQDALARGNTSDALHYALRLPPIPVRNELLARIALARGDRVLAREYFFAAPDLAALHREVMRIARRDPAGAYAFEARVRDRLVALQTHPDAVAEASWIMGSLARACARRDAAARVLWLHRALNDDTEAAHLSPLSEKYLLAVAHVAVQLGDRHAARRWYHRVRNVDPGAAIH